MKFINYNIPLGLGVTNYNNNSIFHNILNYDGITNQKKIHNISKNNNQTGGNSNNTSLNPCEMVFYVFEHKFPTQQYSEIDEEIGGESREEIGGESREEIIDDIQMSEYTNKKDEKRQIKNLNMLFSDTTSHDSLRSILNALKQSTGSSK